MFEPVYSGVLFTYHIHSNFVTCSHELGHVGQSVTCLTADPGAASLIAAWSHTYMEIDHEIISTAILPSADSRRVVVNYKQKYVHEVLSQACAGKRSTDCPDMTIAVYWDVKNQTLRANMLS